VRQYTGEDEPCNSVDLHALPLKHDIISCLGVGARWVTSVPLLQVFHFVCLIFFPPKGNYSVFVGKLNYRESFDWIFAKFFQWHVLGQETVKFWVYLGTGVGIFSILIASQDELQSLCCTVYSFWILHAGFYTMWKWQDIYYKFLPNIQNVILVINSVQMQYDCLYYM